MRTELTVFSDRRKRVLSLSGGKQVVATTGANIYYLTDFWGGGAALVRPDKTVVITSPLEGDRVRAVGHEVEVVVPKARRDVPRALMRELDRGTVLVDDDRDLRSFKSFRHSPELFLRARRVKDEVEIQRIKIASRGLDEIFEVLAKELRPGKTEWDVAAEVMKSATSKGLTPTDTGSALSPTIIASGENGALPHSELSNRKIRAGDLVVADIFFRYKGYHSDETRTFAVGRPSAEMKKHYSAVLEAQETALELIRKGTACQAVHEAAVNVLKKHRVDRFLNHSVGHGVGIDIHELPRIAKGNTAILLKDDVVTDEPGIYMPGKYGIRIEDTVRVDSRPVVLTHFTKELLSVG